MPVFSIWGTFSIRRKGLRNSPFNKYVLQILQVCWVLDYIWVQHRCLYIKSQLLTFLRFFCTPISISTAHQTFSTLSTSSMAGMRGAQSREIRSKAGFAMKYSVSHDFSSIFPSSLVPCLVHVCCHCPDASFSLSPCSTESSPTSSQIPRMVSF